MCFGDRSWTLRISYDRRLAGICRGGKPARQWSSRLSGNFSSTLLCTRRWLPRRGLYLFRRRAGNVLDGIKRWPGTTGRSTDRDQKLLLGCLEEFHGLVKLPFLESGNALVQKVARAQFVRSRNTGREVSTTPTEQKRPVAERGKPRAGFPVHFAYALKHNP